MAPRSKLQHSVRIQSDEPASKRTDLTQLQALLASTIPSKILEIGIANTYKNPKNVATSVEVQAWRRVSRLWSGLVSQLGGRPTAHCHQPPPFFFWWAVLAFLWSKHWVMACPKQFCFGLWACFDPTEPESCSLIGLRILPWIVLTLSNNHFQASTWSENHESLHFLHASLFNKVPKHTLPFKKCMLYFGAKMQVASTFWPHIKSQKISEWWFRLK